MANKKITTKDQRSYKLIKYLKVKLEENELSQRELARLVNINSKTMHNYFSGHAYPDIFTLADICNILEIDIQKLLEVNDANNDEMILQNKIEYRAINYLRQLNDSQQEEVLKAIQFLVNHFKNEN